MRPRPAGASRVSARRGKEKRPHTVKKPRAAPSSTWKQGLTRYVSFLSHTRTLFKRTLRNLILYPVAILCLYPLIAFGRSIFFIVFYLFIWTNVVLALAVFLDEILGLPRKR
jgi:hypothetical protein